MGVFHDADTSGDAGDGDTIYALSSGAPPAGVAVVRVSGPRADAALEAIAGKLPPYRQASSARSSIRSGAKRSTRRWCCGSRRVRAQRAKALPSSTSTAAGRSSKRCLRRWTPSEGCGRRNGGEFTRRAFLSGRLDLTEAEGIADLVAAETEAQRRFALGQMGGSIRVQYEFWRERIIRARGLIEAEIDFSDEEGVTGAWSDRARLDVRGLAVEMQSAMADLRRADRICEGAEVVILGAVNAGKSSLINALARRDVAIVSPEAGTTRDLIEAVLDIGGYRVTLVDTAGLRDAEGSVEREGIRRARARADGADLVLWLSDSRESVYPDELLERRVPVWHVATKADIADEGDLQCVEQISRHIISTVTGEGMDALLSDLGAFLDSTLRGREPPLIARARHRSALAEAVAALDKALAAEAPELAAEHLRIAADRVGTVTGRVSVEDVLDVVFREFCIGK